MKILTAEERARLDALIDYLSKSGAGGGAADDRTVKVLNDIFGTSCGFKCGCPGSFFEGLRDAPLLTLLRAIVCIDEGLLVPPPDGGTPECPDPEDDPDFPPDVLEGWRRLCGYGIVSHEAVLNTGVTVVHGNLGISDGNTVLGTPYVTGFIDLNGASSIAAQVDLGNLWTLLNALPATVMPPSVTGILPPGVYAAAGVLNIPATGLVLDAGGDINATWVIRCADQLHFTAPGAIWLANGAQAKNVLWVCDSCAVDDSFAVQGSIISNTAIIVGEDAFIGGGLFTLNSVIVLDWNIVMGTICPGEDYPDNGDEHDRQYPWPPEGGPQNEGPF